MPRPVHLRFDFVDAHGQPAPLVFREPREIIDAWRLDEVIPAMKRAEAAQANGHFVAGFVAYEAAPAFDPALTTRPPGTRPLLWFGVFDAPASGDAGSGMEPDGAEASSIAPAWNADVTREEYDAAITRIRAAIADGDSYQTNYTFRLRARIDPASLAARYHRLRSTQRVPYAAHFDLGRWQILSLSPELFFRLEAGVITTRPMKGTTSRGRFGTEDDVRSEALRTSVKNRAENVMIVDLMRNDLGRIADVGSVAAPSLFDIERYASVFQMTSTVTGRVRRGTTVTDIFAALFPAGSITGAPKTSSMRLIAEVERAPRGVYCGAIGLMTPDGNAVFNVAIRTAVADTATGDIEYGVGGGVTWDSTAADEYAEALSKASFLDVPPSFLLIETMRLEDGAFIRRDRHLRRLARSAAYFGMPCEAAHVAGVLDDHARLHPSGGRRARLLLSPRDGATVESRPFDRLSADAAPLRVALARTPVSSRDRFLCHKTTHRDVYDQHRAAQPDAFDVLLWNERGELTEFTIGNVVLEVDEAHVTPPIDCGLLGGVFREELLDAGTITERVLTIADTKRASRIWLVNSLREWVAVAL